jgi:hypothetical protein
MLSLINLTIDKLSIIGIKPNNNYSYMYCKIKNYLCDNPPQIKTYVSRKFVTHEQIYKINAYVLPSYFMRRLFPIGIPIYVRAESTSLLGLIALLKNDISIPITFFATLKNIPIGYVARLTTQDTFCLYNISADKYMDINYKVALRTYFQFCNPLCIDINETMVFTLCPSGNTIKIYNSSINENKSRKVAMLEQVMSVYVNTYTECDTLS